MATLPAAGYLESNSRTNAEMKAAFEAIRDIMAESVGGEARTELTIASGAVTPAEGAGGGVFRIDTEGNAASDILDTIAQTNTRDGQIVVLMAENVARVVTINHAAGGTGQILLYDGVDFVFASTAAQLWLQQRGTDWVELFRVVPTEDLTALTSVASDDQVQIWDESANTLRRVAPTVLGAAMPLLATKTASSSADLVFTEFDSALYSSYVFRFDSVAPATDGTTLRVTVSNDGGATYLSTSIYQTYRNDWVVGSAASPNSGTATSATITTSIGNQADEVLQGTVEFFSNRSRGDFRLTYANGSTVATQSDGFFHVPATANGIRFAMASGNIASGTIRMYGIRK